MMMNFLSYSGENLIRNVNPKYHPVIKVLDGFWNYTDSLGRYKKYKLGLAIAGGALRGVFDPNDEVKDIDMFFIEESNMGADITPVELEKEFLSRMRSYGHYLRIKKIFECPAGELTTYMISNLPEGQTLKLQFIKKKIYKNKKELIDSFDINACRLCYYENFLSTTYSAIRDIRKKQITLNVVEYPMATFKRMMKYRDKGYKLPNKTISEFVYSVWNTGVDGYNIDGRFYVD